MRFLLVVLTVMLASGCTEALNGPRLVHREDGRFYIRHAPLSDGNLAVSRWAEALCAERQSTAQVRTVIQYYAFDTRFADFNCVPLPGAEPVADPAAGGDG